MEILSWQFGLFVCGSVVIYHLLSWRWKRLWLLAISYVFYALLDIRYLIVLLVLTTTNYYLADLSTRKNQDVYIKAAISTNLLSFILLKWLTSPYYSVLGISQSKWILPVGFSFYLLQLISFQLDMKSQRISRMPSFETFALFVSYFPKLLSGPIEKPKVFLQNIEQPLLVTNEIVGQAFGLILSGLVRKIIIADLLRVLIPSITGIGVIPTWISVFSFGIQLYNDFLGYTSIVRGVSLFFGLKLTQNFQEPYLSRNFSEFWARWHISLTTWLREIIYFPLSRRLLRLDTKTGDYLNFLFPPLLTMVISGFWHGATLGMIVWGLSHGILLIFERFLYEMFPKLRPSNLNILGQMISQFVTFFIICILWIPFAATGLNQSFRIMKDIFQNPIFGGNVSLIIPGILIIVSFVLDFISRLKKSEIWWIYLPIPVRSFSIAITLILLTAAITYQIQEPVKTFIYQGF